MKEKPYRLGDLLTGTIYYDGNGKEHIIVAMPGHWRLTHTWVVSLTTGKARMLDNDTEIVSFSVERFKLRKKREKGKG